MSRIQVAMRIFLLAMLLCWAPLQAAGPYEALWAYNGAWKVERANQPAESLVNKCALAGRYFACEQMVNGSPGSMLVLIPVAGKDGLYYRQTIRPDGLASARSELLIEGNKWTFTNNWNQGGSTIYYRTVNVFTSKTKIHFEQSESKDNRTWTVTGSGDQVKVAAGR